MLYKLKRTLFLFTLLFAVVGFQSCKEEGCTDPDAENFNADADDDDGTCTYAKTKFIGVYGTGESCNGGNASSGVVGIAEADSAANEIRITNQELWVTVTGIVAGDGFTIDDTFILNGSFVNMVGNGIYSNSDSQESINVNYTLSVDGAIVSECIGVWIKS